MSCWIDDVWWRMNLVDTYLVFTFVVPEKKKQYTQQRRQPNKWMVCVMRNFTMVSTMHGCAVRSLMFWSHAITKLWPQTITVIDFHIAKSAEVEENNPQNRLWKKEEEEITYLKKNTLQFVCKWRVRDALVYFIWPHANAHTHKHVHLKCL